jgi:hypothetical protein
MAILDFPMKKPYENCKTCNAAKEKARKHKAYGMIPENHWRYRQWISKSEELKREHAKLSKISRN